MGRRDSLPVSLLKHYTPSRKRHTPISVPTPLVQVVWDDRQRYDRDPILQEIAGFGQGRLPIDLAMGCLAVVDAPRLSGEVTTDVVPLGFQLVPELPDESTQFPAGLVEKGDVRIFPGT